MTTRIFLAEDHHLVRQGTRLLLESEPDFEVIGEAESGIRAMKETIRLQPDVLIVDIVLPDLNGIEVIREVTRRVPAVKVIPLSMYDTEAYVIEALKAGASGYVLKKSTGDELTRAVREVLQGRIFLSPALNKTVLDAYHYRSNEPADGDPYDTLTKREHLIFTMAAQGMSNPEIAERLLLSVRTVEMHRANLLRKLGIKNQTELVRYALKRGLLD